MWITGVLNVGRAGLTLSLVDEQGQRLATPRHETVDWALSPLSTRRVLMPADWMAFIDAAAQRRREGLIAEHLDAQAVPLFLQPPSGTEALDWEFGLEQLAAPVAQPVRLTRRRGTPRSPFNLPIDVLAVGETAGAMSAVEAASWYQEGREVREQGLVIESTTVGALRSTLRAKTHDIVVASEISWERVLTAVRLVPLADTTGGKESLARPRLIILLAGTEGLHVLPRRYNVPLGTALLVVNSTPGSPTAELLKRFFYGIFHDQPFHGALREANTTDLTQRAWLLADPYSNQNIRISDTLRRVEDLKNAIRYDATPGDVETFLVRARTPSPEWEDIAGTLRSAAEPASTVADAADESERLKVDFSRETRGLVPISHTLVHLRRAERALADVRDRLASLVTRPALARAMAPAQKRYVDIALEWYDGAIENYVWYEKWSPLRPREEYRLRLHIGHRAGDSLVVGDPPALDPLLPELNPGEEGYDLDVAVFEKDFELRSDRVARLWLPALGGSKPVYFVIHAPNEREAAQLRVNVYHKNHLLQGFLLSAAVGESNYVRSEPATKVELDVSTTASFSNLATLHPRALSIGVNLDEDGTHNIMIKKDGYARHPLKISDDVVGGQLKRFRNILKTFTTDADRKPSFPTHPEDGAPVAERFEDAVRSLAELGREMYLGVFQEIEDQIHEDLKHIRGAEDLPIQVARHRGNAVFPWPVLYDYIGPSPGFRNTAPVCRGAPLPNAPESVRDGLEQWRGCPHNPGREVYCVHGFWGFRHRIEQITSGGGPMNVAPTIDAANATHMVCLASSVAQTAGTRLSTSLQNLFGAKFLQFPPPPPADAFGTFMWDAHTRPAVLVLLSHLSNPGGGGAQISLVAAPGGAPVTLTANQVSELTRVLSSWKGQPRSLVLLMACESGATTVATLNDFTMAFKAAGAAAIVGTEAPVYASLAARFAEDLIKVLQQKQPNSEQTALGKAMRDVANTLLSEGNPLGLVFSYCGSADLIIA